MSGFIFKPVDESFHFAWIYNNFKDAITFENILFFFSIQFIYLFIFYFLILKSLILTCVPKHEPPSHFPPHNIPLGHPRAPAPSMGTWDAVVVGHRKSSF